MADDGIVEALQALHRELDIVSEALKDDREDGGRSLLAGLSQSPLLEAVKDKFKGLLEKPGRRKDSRDAVLSGKVTFSDEEWNLNRDFQEVALQVADEIDLDEVEAAKLALLAEDDETALGRSRKECAIIRFHQYRKYLLNCMLLLLELSKEEEELLDQDNGDDLGYLSQYVDVNILRGTPPDPTDHKPLPRFVPACVATMHDIRVWLRRLSEQVTSASVLGRADELQFQETVEFTHISLIQQHELLSVILCYAIEKRKADQQDFVDFIRIFRQATRYDTSIAHLVPVLGTYITNFGSTEGSGSVEQARVLNDIVCQQSDNDTQLLPFLNAAVRAWWVAEYSGWYMEDAAGSSLPDIDIDEEDKQRAKQLTDALKEGAFDFMLSVVVDVRASEWDHPTRKYLRQWLRKRTPTLPPDTIPFSASLQDRLAAKLETFVDAFISNMPDVLRRLKIEEDEQRQTSQTQEDFDLERFLLIIAYSFEGRPEAADAFWGDPENNLAGFLQWASRRATTPVQAAFCEMLQSLSEDSQSATYAHEFLLDEGHQIRKPTSITWVHIFGELEFFAQMGREKPTTSQLSIHRAGKLHNEQAETEPEQMTMLESYLRLMAKLAIQSEPARVFLVEMPKARLIETLFQIVSSQVAPRIRACAFQALSALVLRKSINQSHGMWQYLESCLTGYFMSPTSNRTLASSTAPPPSSFYMEALFQEMSSNIDDTSAFIQFMVILARLPEGYGPLNDVLPFPEDLGASSRMRSGIEPYIDFSLGHMFSTKAQETVEALQQRILRLCCLDLALTCLASFNEDLIVFSNKTNIAVDSAIQTTDLETYVTLHPFARVMEWMFDSKFMKGILVTIHQSPADVGKAAPDSPLILGVLRAVELVSKALDLQATYVDLVRPIVKPQNRTQSRSPFIPSPNGAYSSIEDGLITSLTLISDLGGYCGIGHPDLTLASLKLLETISSSPRIISAWHAGPTRQSQRNKAIVALEEQGDSATIAGTFIAEFRTPLDFHRQADSPEYLTKVYILDFLYSCLQANPNRPTIAHLLLGFRCKATTLEIEPGSAFDQRSALFHTLLPVILEVSARNEEGVMLQWLVTLKYKVMRILKILWSSPLSAGIVLDDLRDNDFLFHLLMQGLVAEQGFIWDGYEADGPDFLTRNAAQGYVDYLSIRAMALEYITRELCSVSHGQTPGLKRRIFDALGGQIRVDGLEAIPVPSVFEFHDSLPQESLFATPPPDLDKYRGLDLRPCLEEDDDSNLVYNLDKVQEILLLRRSEAQSSNQIVLQQDATAMETEEETLLLYLVYLNRFVQVKSYSHKVLKAWTKLLTVMTDCNDFKGTNKVSFILQTLQATLPSLEMHGSENPDAAYELAQLARVLLFELDFTTMTSTDKQNRAVENLISDKLFQLLEICLNAIAKWAGNQELRTVYYSICYRHLTGLVDHGSGVLPGLRKTAKTIQAFGEKLLNVVCDDAFGGDPGCQSAALVLLGTLVQLGKQENDNYVVETLNKLNFIGILVDSLRGVLEEWESANQSGTLNEQHYLDAKLALLLQLCQTRSGAKNVLHANLFRAIEQSGLFRVDPELQVDSADHKALERHYTLLVKVSQIIGAAIVSRGSHNVLQGRRFLTEHRMLVMHVLKRSAGIGAGAGVGKMDGMLSDRINELAEAFMVLITATGFLEFESSGHTEDTRTAPIVFH